jgi:two-component system sensor histidine kinase KdpD
MTAEPHHPDPDALLAAIHKAEVNSRGGRLWVFFGMAAGVGKTYAMLKAAQERLREGRDVVAGIVETHGRSETDTLLAGLPVIPHRQLEYRGVGLTEMDLDAILSRKPELVLVDELAHTNVPGLRHPKRWHDVVELLDAGIDVYTTINVQHIESRKESVETITGITIRESVPDSLLERASQVILIDITPAELLKRLAEGKVYLGDKAETALNNFFKEDRLTALREMALRLTAEKVDNELQSLTATKGSEAPWKPSERLMVAVSHSPYSAELIRATRRLAFGLDAPWIGVNVDTGTQLTDEDRATLSKNLALVIELGGEVISTADADAAAALKRIAHQRNVTQLIIGRPTRRWLRDTLHGGTLLDRLARETGTFDVHVLRTDWGARAKEPHRWLLRPEAGMSRYALAFAFVAGVALLSSLLMPFLGYRAVGFLFLLTVLSISLFLSLGPVLLTAFVSALVWDYFFIPPPGTFHISHPDDVAMCVAYFLAAAITGMLTRRVRQGERMLRLREKRMQVLYSIVQTMTSGRDKPHVLAEVADQLGAILNGECAVIPAGTDTWLEAQPHPARGWLSTEKERAVAQWTFLLGQPAGWSTDTLPLAEAMYVPLKGNTETVGVLGFRPNEKVPLLKEEADLLFSVAQQLAILMERQLFQERTSETERLKASEKLHQTILDSVSHEIRTPLTGIMGAASALQNELIVAKAASRTQLTQELVESAERLNRVVANLLDMSRLSSGTLTLKRDWHDVGDLVSVALDGASKALSRHSVKTSLSDHLPLVKIDFQLFEQAFSNLLLNAAAHTPPGTNITIQARLSEGRVELTVADDGPGIPADSLSRVFEKFYRVPGTGAGGTGTGLAIAKAIVDAHGGTISVQNRPEGGVAFSIRLPVEKQPHVPSERGDQ